MTTYILILFFHVGTLGSGNSNAVTNVPGFISLEECTKAGKQANKLIVGTVKEVSFICIPQTDK